MLAAVVRAVETPFASQPQNNYTKWLQSHTMTDRAFGMQPRNHRALRALGLLSQKWQPVVIAALHQTDSLRFNELLEAIPKISGKMLSETLDELQESGVVRRREVSESPLRVEYDLTEAGRDLEPIFESLSEWGKRHLEQVTPRVVIADGDRRLTEMYSQWLSDQYIVSRAHDKSSLDDTFDERVAVIVLDEALPGIDTKAFVNTRRADCRIILLVGDRPGFDLLEVACDDILRKPVVRDTVLDAIEKQLADDGSSTRRELASLVARQTLFESTYSSDQLEKTERYREIRTRIEHLFDQDMD